MNVLIIGNGIAGVSTAYHLSELGIEVTVVGDQRAGTATFAAAGIIAPWISQRRNKRWKKLVYEGAAYYPVITQALKEQGIENTGYEQNGLLRTFDTVEQRDRFIQKMKPIIEDASLVGNYAVYSPEETTQRYPFLHRKYSSLFLSNGGRVDGATLHQALQQIAEQRGVHFIQGTAELQEVNGEVCVQVDGQKMPYTHLVITAGAWLKEVVAPLYADFPVRMQKAQIAHLQVTEANENWPVIIPAGNHYLVPFHEGEIASGSTYENDQYEATVTVGGVQQLLTKTLEIAPLFETAELKEVRVGFRPQTPNYAVVMDHLPGYPNVWVINGLGSSGLTMGPFIGKVMAEQLSGQPTSVDIKEYSIAEMLKTN